MIDKLNLIEFENLSQQDKDTYILYLLTATELTDVDKHILKFNTIGVKSENILEFVED
jgi:hypothetical protein